MTGMPRARKWAATELFPEASPPVRPKSLMLTGASLVQLGAFATASTLRAGVAVASA